ncbi:MAG: M23 family metallopeptidase [Anaerolineae bacterium]|nr:M23 family metallopeptidase [Anaerolineae bacterium]
MKIIKTSTKILLPLFFGGSLILLWGLVWLAGGLKGVLAWYFIQLLALLAIPFFVGLIIYGVIKRRLSVFTALLGCVLGACMLPLVWMFGLVTVAYPSNLQRTQGESLNIHSPLKTTARVAWGGDGLAVNYHAASPQQRWAYDLVVEPAFHGSAHLKDYGCYGLPVVAPLDAEVIAIHDGEADQVPGKLSNVNEAPEGNYVALKAAQGTHLILAHMQPGSLQVKAGETVKEGAVLGLCGNSGNTSEPHVHIHLQREDPTLNLSRGGISEGLPLYFRGPQGAFMPSGGFENVKGVMQARGDFIEPLNETE